MKYVSYKEMIIDKLIHDITENRNWNQMMFNISSMKQNNMK